MSVRINPAGSGYYNQSQYGLYGTKEKEDEVSESSLRKAAYEQRKKEECRDYIAQSKAYGESLKASRTKEKSTALEKKKVQYSFKRVSAQILRSKTSVAAKRAVMAARREVARLKRLKSGDAYDPDELQLAIDHAKSLERVAKKKAAHLEQEEMIERCGTGEGLGRSQEFEEKADPKEDLQEEAEEAARKKQREADAVFREEELSPERIEELLMEAQEAAEAADQRLSTAEDTGKELTEEMLDGLFEMMEDTDLTGLAESMIAPDLSMSEDDLKLLKIKHRAKEMKEIAEADRDYLKGLFALEKSKAAGMAAGSFGSVSTGATGGLDLSIAPSEGAAVDVSL